ncbi:MAG: hypothetical protein ACTS2F_31220 [Thainema sp.]
MTLHWSAYTGSKPRSHSNSINFTKVISGTLLERKYTVSGGQLLLKSERMIQAGDWAYTLPHQVHELVVFNNSAKTLHFYFPKRQEIHAKHN